MEMCNKYLVDFPWFNCTFHELSLASFSTVKHPTACLMSQNYARCSPIRSWITRSSSKKVNLHFEEIFEVSSNNGEFVLVCAQVLTFFVRRNAVGSSPNYDRPIIPCGDVQTASSKMEDDAVPTIEELKKLKVVDLKARLASLGLQTSGSFD